MSYARRSYSLLIGIASVFVGVVVSHDARGQTMWAYIGTYTSQDSQGIYAAEFDSVAGRFGELKLAAKSENPSFLAIHPSQKYLYAVGEVGQYQGQSSGFVRAFSIDHKTGQLTELNTVASQGAAPCHLVVSANGRTILVANYSGGNVAAISVGMDGRLGSVMSTMQHVGSSVDASRQKAPHAHSINLDRDNRFAFAADLGLDKILIYRLDTTTGQLSKAGAPADARVRPGSGPRHFAFHPSGNFAYVINEMSSTINSFRYDAATGSLDSLQVISTLPSDYDQASHTAEVVVHPSGRFVYGSNRGHDSIAAYRVEPNLGQLTLVEIESTRGRAPRNFVVDPSGKFLLAENQGSNTVVVFRIDPATGQLEATGEVLAVPVPVCIRFLKSP